MTKPNKSKKVKQKTNVQFVKELMEINNGGALGQSVVMTAIEKYCEQVIENKESILKKMANAPVNGEAWVASCEEILGKVMAHYEKTVPHIEEGCDICTGCADVFEYGTLKAISETEFDLLCPRCLLELKAQKNLKKYL
ncbi:MAG: hypothetical protein WC375_00320 [Methanomassiliicoccales archaeon]|jgi:hypothetical protein